MAGLLKEGGNVGILQAAADKIGTAVASAINALQSIWTKFTTAVKDGVNASNGLKEGGKVNILSRYSSHISTPRNQLKSYGFGYDFSETLSAALTDVTMRRLLQFTRTVTECFNIKVVKIKANQNCKIYFYPQQNVTVDGIDSRFIPLDIKKNVEYTLPVDISWRQYSGEPQLFIRNVYDDAGTEINTGTTPTTVIGSYGYYGEKTTDDFDYESPETELFLGDSITRGSGVTTKLDTWQWQVRNMLRSSGRRVRIIAEGYPGKTMATLRTMVLAGQCDFEKITEINICMGVNDAIQSVSSSTYVSAALDIANYYLGIYPNVPIRFCLASPLLNATDEAKSVVLRAALKSAVTALNNPRVTSIDLGTSFVATDASKYADGVHPNASGTLLIAQNYFSQRQTLGI